MPSKKSVAQAEFEADVLARIISLEEDRSAANAQSRLNNMDGRLASLEDSGVHEARRAVGEREAFAEMQERLLSLETSSDAVKYMWESMPDMMMELRKKHSEIAREVTNIIGTVNEIKTQERHMERAEQRAFDEERLLAVNAVKDTVVQAQRQIQEISSMLTDATKALLPPPSDAQVCKHCGFHWWEDKRCLDRGYREPNEHFPRDDRRRTRQRCYKCDEIWEPVRYAFTIEGRRYYQGLS